MEVRDGIQGSGNNMCLFSDHEIIFIQLHMYISPYNTSLTDKTDLE